ncbi:hypothetical protein B6U91_01030 [Candidatus Pacearchaeota archaeon ex4484_71]|nr:MAG: hypothetical protein B6U91_01030 [Candidatus Pacearchaeota archaeon ex4484_71]
MGEKDIVEEGIKSALSLIAPDSMYFAHPVNFYEGSKFNSHGKTESNLIKKISREFPNYKIHNPNQSIHQENYQLWKKQFGNGMKYYFEVVLPKMSACIYLVFEDGMIGKGVFGEAEHLLQAKKPVWEINENGIITPISKMDHSRMLSVEETRERVYPKK